MPARDHRTRTVAFVGHTGAGKTSLIERMLFDAHEIDRLGSVADGTTTCDIEPEEIARGHSLCLAIAPIHLGDERIDLIDTPGLADFGVEVERALSVADVAVVVVAANEGIQAQTEVAWRLALREGIPRVLVVNKLDREGADFQSVIERAREVFGSGIAPVELPIGQAEQFRGVVDLLADEAIVYESGVARHCEVPSELAESEHVVREQLVEGIIVADDELTARYLDGDVLSMLELEEALSIGLADGSVVPVVCTSAQNGIGVDRLASLLSEIAPCRSVRAKRAGEDIEIERDPEGPAVLRAFRTVLDPFAGRLTWFEVVSGSVRTDQVLCNTRSRTDERLHVLQVPRGRELRGVDQVVAGDLVAVPKLADTMVGDVLAPKGYEITMALPHRITPTQEVAVVPRRQGDDDKLMVSLHRLEEEDAGLRVHQDDESHQTVLRVAGDTHLAVALERLSRKYSVEVEVVERVLPMRQTITGTVTAEGRHKKQTGGHGQFAVVTLRVEPLERGAGFEFVDEVVGGAIPRHYIPAVERGVERAMRQGGELGHPFVDLRVTCLDGKHHSVDSSEAAFELAGHLAFEEAVASATIVVLEPISRVRVEVPTRMLGDILSDLNARRGRVLETDPGADGTAAVVAEVPSSSIAHFTAELRALTGGHGSFEASFERFAEMPSHLGARTPG